MKRCLIGAAFALCLSACTGPSPTRVTEAGTPPRLKRADSFLGIHFDFHAGPDCKEVGKNTTPAMIEAIIDQVRPDYIQIDCKGHPGFSSYPTKVGNPVPGFVGDPLRVWRDVTAARGIALYLHYSGVYDSDAVKKPGWAAINTDGTPNAKATSFWGPYAQQLLIPQLRELAGDYRADGAWVDGECWSSVPDYSPAALAAFQRQTGITTVPRKAGDPHWYEFLQFHREAFRRYLRDYVTAVNKTHPGFQLCSNWAFTDHMPEPVTAPMAFLSGDYSANNAVNSARLSARFLAHQGRAWDLMAWSFSNTVKPPENAQKPAVQIKREAAVVLAQGGGFQAYFKQKRDGSIFDEQMTVMADVAAFCRARQALSHRAQTVPQIAVLLSQADQYRRNNSLYGRNLSRVHGVLQALLESQQCVDVVGEHHLAGRFAEYPLIIVPECDYLEPAFRDQLAGYVRAGGQLLLVGPGSARLFERELGITLMGDVKPNAAATLTLAGKSSALTARWQAARLGPGARALGQIAATKGDTQGVPAASVTTLGRGRIAAVYFTAGQVYAKDRPAGLRDFIVDVTRELFPQPIVTVTGSHDVDVVLARNHGKLLVHLINTSSPHQTVPILESVAPVGPLQVTIQASRAPSRVTLEPSARPLAHQHRDGRVLVTVPRLEIHDIVVVESN